MRSRIVPDSPRTTPRPPSEQEKRALNCSVTGAFVVRPPSHRIKPPDEGGRDEGEARARRRKRVSRFVLHAQKHSIPYGHMGAPAFNQAAQTMHGMERFAHKHAEADCRLLQKVKLTASKRRRGEDTLRQTVHA